MQKVLLAVLLALAGSVTAYADGMNQTVGNTTQNPRWTVTVFNDSASTIVSGDVVIWDNDYTEFDRNGYPYVTTTTTADSPWVAGVVDTGLTCADQTLCEIVVYGMAKTKLADSTDASAEDTTVATSTIAGEAGDWGAATGTCYLGILAEDTVSPSQDTEFDFVFVNPGCED